MNAPPQTKNLQSGARSTLSEVERLSGGFHSCVSARVLVANLPPLRCRNRRLDLDGSNFVCCIVTIAAPGPVFGLFYKTAMDGIAVDVLQFLDALCTSEDVEVVVTGLPEMLWSWFCFGEPGWWVLWFWVPHTTVFWLCGSFCWDERTPPPRFTCLRATDCLRALIAVASVPRSGSLTSRWTCSGMTTYPITSNR